MSDSAAFSETVESLIARFLADSSPDPLGIRPLARRLNALPAYLDMGGCFAVRPDGEVVSFPWDADDAGVETCPLIRNVALFQGGRKYPELRPFTPARPPGATDCPDCDGSGVIPGLPDNVVCHCGGAGWLPPGVVVRWRGMTDRNAGQA